MSQMKEYGWPRLQRECSRLVAWHQILKYGSTCFLHTTKVDNICTGDE